MHLAEVVAIVDAFAGDHPQHQIIKQAGWLHDTLEDTALTEADLQDAGFSEALIGAVRFCSDVAGPNRSARKRATYRKIRQALNRSLAGEGEAGSPLGAIVKLADRVANLRATLRSGNARLAQVYLGEAEVFRLAIVCRWLPEGLLAEIDALIDRVRAR